MGRSNAKSFVWAEVIARQRTRKNKGVMDQQAIRASRHEYIAKIEKLRSAFEPLRLEMIEGTQYDRNWELFVDAVLDLLGEPNSETQYKAVVRQLSGLELMEHVRTLALEKWGTG